MSKFRILSALFLIAWCAELAQASHPIVRNFTNSTYGAGPQIWEIVQAPDGTMLFGNSHGLLEYDSGNWRLHRIDNHTAVRSIYIDENSRRVYVGASNDFGYFTSDPATGHISYTSLRPTIITDDNADFSEIWDIHASGDNIWFQGDFKIFAYDGTRTSVYEVPDKITTSCLVNGVPYFATADGTIRRISDSGMKAVSHDKRLGNSEICAILPNSADRLMLVTRFNGLYLYDGRSISPYQCPYDAFLRENQVFTADFSGEYFVFGTVSNGAIVHNIRTGNITYINRSNGLQNSTVLCTQFDNLGNLWLGLDNGIDYVMLNTPIRRLLADTNRYGAGYASMLYGETLLLGTNQGLYSTRYTPASQPEPRDLTLRVKGQVWDIARVEGTTFICSDAGLYYMNGAEVRHVDDVPGSLSVVSLRSLPGYAMVSTYNNFYLIRRNPSGSWTGMGRIDGYNDIPGSPVVDSYDYIWIQHWLKGVYRLHFDPETHRFDDVQFYNSASGLPSDDGNRPTLLNSELVISTPAGFYHFDPAIMRFKPHDGIAPQLRTDGTSRLYFAPDNAVWVTTNGSIRVITTTAENSVTVDSISYLYLADKLIPGFENLNFTVPGHLLVSSQDGFYDIDISRRATTTNITNPVKISAITTNHDSVLYARGVFNDTDTRRLTLPYDCNSLHISFNLPEYRADNAILYSIRLDNYDNDWSAPSLSTSKEYTHLSEGEYTFRVQAINTYTGEVRESAIPIRVLPPWYRSIPAIIIYAIFLIVVIILIIKLFVHMSRRQASEIARRKESELTELQRRAREEAMQKDVEIERLKSEQLEQEIKSKGVELSQTTMNVIRKNEILMEISERLGKILDGIDTTIEKSKLEKQINRINELIRENISHDDIWRNFTQNFDLVYDNYLKRLVERFPQLTVADQRLCAYIKMGLSSKEIAPLLNISYRSVEMNRYRLRKKMELPTGTTLQEFLLAL